MASRLARIASKADAALDGRYDSTSSEEEEEMRAVPRGCLGKVGAAMVASAKAGEDEYARPDGERSSVVDQAQFRNLQVGVGYRASFVVRQPGSEPPPAPAAKRRREPEAAAAPPKKAKKEKKEKKKKKHKKKEKKKHKKKKGASSSSSDDDDDDDAAAAAAAAVDADGPIDGEAPRKLALFEALLLDRCAALDAAEARRRAAPKGASSLADAGSALLDM